VIGHQLLFAAQRSTGPVSFSQQILQHRHAEHRLSPAVVLRFSFWAPDVIEVLDRICSEVGYSSNHLTS
jgi:hypothetical protein